MFPGLGLYFTDVAQHLRTARWDPDDRSPRLSSGNPRMLYILLIVLVREFESRRGEISNLFSKKRKKNQQLLRAPIDSVGKHSSTQIEEGRKS